MWGDYITQQEILSQFPQNYTIQDAVSETMHHIKEESERGGKILVSISGGSDSDIMMDIFERIGYPPGLVTYIWYDTGLEFEATKQHLDWLEEKYGVSIIRRRPVLPVAQAVRKYGVPFISKRVAMYIDRLQQHGFNWEDTNLEDSLAKHGRCMSALKWWYGTNGPGRFTIAEYAGLKEFLMKNPPPRISDKCCDYAKKMSAAHAVKELSATLNCTGVRQREGGARATAYHSCFSEATNKKVAEFRPLFYFTDEDKQEYKSYCDVRYSDCYEVYGMTRTGCAGCPFASKFEDELKIIKEYEPKLYNAVNKFFGPSYEYTRRYREFKELFKAQKREQKIKQKEIENHE